MLKSIHKINGLLDIKKNTIKPPVLGRAPQVGEIFNIPITSRVRTKDPLRKSRSNKDLSVLLVEDKMNQVKRLIMKVTSKDMLQSHDKSIEAMSNSVHDARAGLPVHNVDPQQLRIDNKYNNTPHTVMRWRAAQNVIRTLVHLPKSMGH